LDDKSIIKCAGSGELDSTGLVGWLVVWDWSGVDWTSFPLLSPIPICDWFKAIFSLNEKGQEERGKIEGWERKGMLHCKGKWGGG
jgi:hypothetical protein